MTKASESCVCQHVCGSPIRRSAFGKRERQILLGHRMRRLVLHLVPRPDNGHDLPLTINFVQLPVFDARTGNLIVDEKIKIKCHQPQVAILVNLRVVKLLFEFVLRCSQVFRKSIQSAGVNPIELGVIFANTINLFLVVKGMKQHIGAQHELRQGVPVLVNNVLSELLQHAANFREVISIGIEFIGVFS